MDFRIEEETDTLPRGSLIGVKPEEGIHCDDYLKWYIKKSFKRKWLHTRAHSGDLNARTGRPKNLVFCKVGSFVGTIRVFDLLYQNADDKAARDDRCEQDDYSYLTNGICQVARTSYRVHFLGSGQGEETPMDGTPTDHIAFHSHFLALFFYLPCLDLF